MSWRAEAAMFDLDTRKMIEISVHFLHRFFGHDETASGVLMETFLRQYREIFDEDFFHHEGAYRVAAIVHYLVHLAGDQGGIGTWLEANDHKDGPYEAAEYFREHYFNR